MRKKSIIRYREGVGGNKDERGHDATSPALEHSLLHEKVAEKKSREKDQPVGVARVEA